MTLRQELELLGPEAVRRGMVAFEPGHGDVACEIGTCCFMAHAAVQHTDLYKRYDAHNDVIRLLGCVPCTLVRPAVESNFEEWTHDAGYVGGREVLRQECIALPSTARRQRPPYCGTLRCRSQGYWLSRLAKTYPVSEYSGCASRRTGSAI